MFHIAVFDIIIVFMYLSNFVVLHQEKAKPTIKIHCAFFLKKTLAFFANKVEQESKNNAGKTNQKSCPSTFDRVFIAK